MVLAMEKEEWKPFRNALSKSDRKNFDDMWDIPRLYASACSNSVLLLFDVVVEERKAARVSHPRAFLLYHFPEIRRFLRQDSLSHALPY
jgi:hypothetical protein